MSYNDENLKEVKKSFEENPFDEKVYRPRQCGNSTAVSITKKKHFKMC